MFARKNWPSIIGIYCGVFCLSAGLCLAGPETSSELAFRDLDGVLRHPLDSGGKIASVVIFYWHDCPVCNGYAPEIGRICDSHTNFAFYIVQVDPDLSAPAAKEHARQYDLRAPVLLDPQHRLVAVTKATVTPEAVIFGRNGQVLYRGRIDDLYVAPGKKRRVVRQHDLLDALDAIAAGKPVKNKETTAIGCFIQPAAPQADAGQK